MCGKEVLIMKKVLIFVLAVVLAIGMLSACASDAGYSEDKPLSVATLAGPTGMGMIEIIKSDEYDVQVFTAPDQITPKIINGEVDVATIPSNLASVLYNKTQGAIKVVGVNTMGVLYILENGDTVNSISDLEGKTIYATGQGATPEFVLNEVLAQNGVNATVQFMGAHADLANAMAAGDVTLALVPEPFVSVVMAKNKDVKVKVDINELWKEATGSDLPMGVTIVSKELSENNAAMQKLIEDYSASVEYVTSNTENAAADIEESGIIGSADIAKNAIPRCAISFVTGQEAKGMLEEYFSKMFESAPASIGGSLPDDEFYYIP